ncbi:MULTISPECIES: conjugal transfer mating-pair stabilization protein TraG [unclassified Providencia]|uniref:conjugal transfer mating-pair stabilization protein TraG n=1 Tax=unclassified Providencia TaxID=2633465 RepID=UPI00234A1FB3|nr:MULTISPECIES: conjugal transfer mating-pair stabilization protein TraG [unclassified Providencia]
MANPLEITVLYGVDIVYQTFQAVAAIMQNNGWYWLLTFVQTMGVLVCIVKYIQTRDLRTFFIWGFIFVIVSAMLLTPKTEVVIRDMSTPMVVKKVDNVPVGLAVPFWFVTEIGNGTARMYDTFFSQPDEFQYTKTGLLFGQKLLQDSYTLGIKNPEFNMNFGAYTINCIIPDMELNHKYTISDLFNNSEVYNKIFANASPVRGIYYKFANSSQAQYLTCKDAAARLQPILVQEAGNPNSQTLSTLGRKYAIGENGQQTNVILPSRVDSVYSKLIGASNGSVDILKQNLTANALRNSLNQFPAAMDNTADLVDIASQQSLMKMKLAQLSSFEVASEMLPMMHTAFLTLMIGIFPIMVLALFIKEIAWAVVKNYLSVLGSLMLWAVMFAIFNHVINTLTAQTLHGQQFTISNMDTALKNASSMAGVASWLMLSIPFISFKLFTGLGQQIASAGSYLGNALMSGTSADAAAVSHGNYNLGNMSMQNINGFKTDLNHSYRSGLSSVQTETGAMVTSTPSGQTIYEANMSKLPMKLDTSSMLDSSFSKAMSAQQRETQSYQEGYRSSVNDSYSVATALSNNFGKSAHTDSQISQDVRDSIDTIARESKEASNSQMVSQNSDRNSANSTNTSYTLSGGVGGKLGAGVDKGVVAGAQVNLGYNVAENETHQDMTSEGTRVSDNLQASESFANSKAAQTVRSLSNGDIDKISDAETRGLVYDLRANLNKASENFASYNDSLSKEKTISQQANLTESERLSAAETLDHEFAQYVTDKVGVENATPILTNAGSAEARAQREQLKDEFTSDLANSIREGHFNNESKVNANYQGMNIPTDALKYGADSYDSNSQKLSGYADKIGIVQKVSVVDGETGNSKKVSLYDSVNFKNSQDGQANSNTVLNQNNSSIQSADDKRRMYQHEIDSQSAINKKLYDKKE